MRVAALLFAVAWGSNHFVPLLLVYRARLRLSAAEIAILFGVYAIGLLPGLLLGGPLSDRAGRRAVVLPSACVALAGTGALAWGLEGFGVLLAGRFIVGLGAGATFSAGTAWVQDLADGEPAGTGARRAAIALSSGFGFGPLVAAVCAQWLPWPLQLPYAVQGLVLAPAIAAVATLPGLRGAAPSGAPPRTEGKKLPAGFGPFALSAPWVFGFAAVSTAVLPALIRARLGSYAVAYAGVVTALTLLAGVLVQRPLRPWPPHRSMRFGLAVGVVGLIVGAFAAGAMSPLGALLASTALGCGYGGCLISGLRFIETRADPDARGRATGVYYALTYIGFAAPLALATLAKHTGDLGSLLVVLGLALATLGVVARSRPAE